MDLLSEDRAIKDGEEDCDHFFIMKDDIGTVCRICGYIEKSIETIIDLQFGKVSLSFLFLSLSSTLCLSLQFHITCIFSFLLIIMFSYTIIFL